MDVDENFEHINNDQYSLLLMYNMLFEEEPKINLNLNFI